MTRTLGSSQEHVAPDPPSNESVSAENTAAASHLEVLEENPLLRVSIGTLKVTSTSSATSDRAATTDMGRATLEEGDGLGELPGGRLVVGVLEGDGWGVPVADAVRVEELVLLDVCVELDEPLEVAVPEQKLTTLSVMHGTKKMGDSRKLTHTSGTGSRSA
jgi:hypothetical protein